MGIDNFNKGEKNSLGYMSVRDRIKKIESDNVVKEIVPKNKGPESNNGKIDSLRGNFENIKDRNIKEKQASSEQIAIKKDTIKHETKEKIQTIEQVDLNKEDTIKKDNIEYDIEQNKNIMNLRSKLDEAKGQEVNEIVRICKDKFAKLGKDAKLYQNKYIELLEKAYEKLETKKEIEQIIPKFEEKYSYKWSRLGFVDEKIVEDIKIIRQSFIMRQLIMEEVIMFK